MKNRILALATVLAILLSLLPASVIATEEDNSGYEAQIGQTKYVTLSEALALGGEIKLLNNVNISNTLSVSGTVVLDLNGKTITGTPAEEKAYSVISNTGKLTINDSVGTGNILCDHKLTGSTSYAVNTITNSGALIINGGTITNTSTSTNQIGYAIDNNSTSNNAILIVNNGTITVSGSSSYYDGIRQFCNNTKVENSVTVTGGSVSSMWLQNPSDGDTDKNTKDVTGSVTITGGTVNALYLEPSTGFQASVTGGHVGKISYFQTAEGRDLTGFITGGTFGNDPSSYVAAGCSTSKSNTNIWSVYTPVAKVGSATFGSLADAVAAAKDEVVKLLKDVSGSGIVINKNITIDFGGYTYTLTEPPVGSSGTESLGFQILQGNTVTLQNGRLTVDKNYAENYAVLIQNYANLTLTSMNLDGTNLDRHIIKDYDYSYVLSNNSGNVRLEGSTHITANNDGDAYAFDVCKYSSYEAPTVTVDTTGRIIGKIEVTPGLEGNLTIEGGTFSFNPSAYLVDGKIATLNNGLFYVTEPANAPDVSVDVTTKDTTTEDIVIDNGLDTSETDVDELKNAIANAVNKEETKQDLQNAANNLQHDASVVGNKEDAKTALKDQPDYDATAEVEVQVKPYLDVTVKEYKPSSKTVKLDIKALYDVVAVQKGPENQVTASATLKTAQPMTNVTTAITITIPLPDGFVEPGTKTVYVYHTKEDRTLYIHEATVSDDATSATFVNDQGFSSFEVKTEKTELFDLDAANVKFGSTFDMNFVFSKNKLTDQDVLEGCYAKIVRKYADGRNDDVQKIPYNKWSTDESNLYWKITYSGLNAKEMCDVINVQIFDKEDNALSTVWTDSIQDYASRVFNKSTTTARDYKMIISMLDYGATAQWYYNYNQLNPANALVTEVHRTKANEAV